MSFIQKNSSHYTTTRFLLKICFFSTFLSFSFFPDGTAMALSPLGGADRPIRMMFVPSGDSQVILKGGQEIASLLQAETGLHFKTSVATSYAAVVEAMGAGQVDVGWLATFSYVMAKEKFNVDLLLIVMRFGSPFYRGQIMVRADSKIKTLADLKGATFAYGDPASASGHLYPKALLRSKGLDPDTLFKNSIFAGSHNAVVLSLLKGRVSAGAAYDDARAAVADSYPDVFDQIRVIAYTSEIPNDTVSVRNDLDPALKIKIKEGLQRLARTPVGSKVLKQVYGISGLADLDALFDPVRKARQFLHPKEMR